MARIKITPEQVRQVAQQFAQASSQSQEMVSRLTNAINSMQPEWEGMTSQRFYGDFQQWSAQMRGCPKTNLDSPRKTLDVG